MTSLVGRGDELASLARLFAHGALLGAALRRRIDPRAPAQGESDEACSHAIVDHDNRLSFELEVAARELLQNADPSSPAARSAHERLAQVASRCVAEATRSCLVRVQLRVTDPPSTTSASCDTVCVHLMTCLPTGDSDVCLANCAPLRASCRACLAAASCDAIEASACDVVCGPDGGAGGDGPEPRPGRSCIPVTFGDGRVGDGTRQLHTGSRCTLPGDCLSQAMLTADISDDDSQSWCANKGDCRTPRNEDEQCPAGWRCMEVMHYPNDEIRRHLCVPPDLDACTVDELAD